MLNKLRYIKNLLLESLLHPGWSIIIDKKTGKVLGKGPNGGPRILGDSYFIGIQVWKDGEPVKYTNAQLKILDVDIRYSGLIVPDYVKEAIKDLKNGEK